MKNQTLNTGLQIRQVRSEYSRFSYQRNPDSFIAGNKGQL